MIWLARSASMLKFSNGEFYVFKRNGFFDGVA